MLFIEYTTPPGSQVWIVCEESKEKLKRIPGYDIGLLKVIAEQMLIDLKINYGGIRVSSLETGIIKPL